MRSLAVDLILFVAAVTLPCLGRELDHRCLEGDCVILSVQNGKVFAERTGEFAGKREIERVDNAGIPFVPSTEAPIRYARTSRGWVAVVSAFLPKEYDFDGPELRLYIFDSQRKLKTVSNQYNFLGSFNAGRIFKNSDSEFVQVSSTGAHAYVVRTVVWLLPTLGSPVAVLDVPGLLNHVQQAATSVAAGLWIDLQTYDGMHAETKGQKTEFWRWNSDRQAFTLVHKP